MWCIPPKQNSAFVAAMEDVLDLCTQPFDANFPTICMDEKPYQLLKDIRPPLPSKAGSVEKVDNEYKREGTCSIFMFNEPLGGWRHVHAGERRTKVDWAYEIKELLITHYPDVPKVRLVCDNLNTHVVSFLYEAFSAVEVRGLAERLEIYYTPKYGSWLNVAEFELSVLSRQCLGRGIDRLDVLNEPVFAWERERNASQRGVDWQFTTADARIKLKRICPTPHFIQ